MSDWPEDAHITPPPVEDPPSPEHVLDPTCGFCGVEQTDASMLDAERRCPHCEVKDRLVQAVEDHPGDANLRKALELLRDNPVELAPRKVDALPPVLRGVG